MNVADADTDEAAKGAMFTQNTGVLIRRKKGKIIIRRETFLIIMKKKTFD